MISFFQTLPGVVFNAIYGLNGSACLALGIVTAVVTTVLIHRSPTVPVDTRQDKRVA